MCLRPSVLKNGVVVGCRECWQCRNTAIENWVGRNIAETKTATVSYAVTLTYGRSWDGVADHIRSTQLMISDVQKLMKRLRKAGCKVRYQIAGEYGGSLGRAHWHGIFHFYGDVMPEGWEGEHLEWSPEEYDAVGGIHIPQWVDYARDRHGNIQYDLDGVRIRKPMGHVHIRKATYGHVHYALKYMLKEVGDAEQHLMMTMSRNPPLGHAYFVQLARETAEAGLPIEDLRYKFHVRTRSGEEKLLRFILRGRMAEMYVQAYIDRWRELHGNKEWPLSDLVSTFAEFGRIGDEQRLTEAAQEKLPGPNSLFASDGMLKADLADLQEAKTFHGWLRVKDRQYMLKRRLERMARNGKKKKRHGERVQRALAFDKLRSATGITEAEFNKLGPAEQRFALARPADYKSLRDLRASDAAKFGVRSRARQARALRHKAERRDE